MPKDWCPFCPSSGNVPDKYDVYKYDNDFPALSTTPPTPDDVATDFFKTAPAYGKCEVILYSSGHTVTMPELSDAHMKKIELETKSSTDYKKEKGSCLFCDLLKEEIKEDKRILFKNQYFTVFLPFFIEYPYGVYILSNSHKQYITEFNEEERNSLAITIRDTVGMLDSLFGYAFPYMMCMYNAPVNNGNFSDYHFHIEFFPSMRSAEKQKFNASSETGAWAHCNPTCPEEAAKELKEAYHKFKSDKQ